MAIYIVRDSDTKGIDFLLWGTDAAAAQVSLWDAVANGLAVELVIMPRCLVDADMSERLGLDEWEV